MDHPGWSDPDYRLKNVQVYNTIYKRTAIFTVQLCIVYKCNIKHKK